MDANLLHISYEGGELEDPWVQPQPDMWRWTVSPQQAPNQAETIVIGYQNGDPVSLNGETLSPATMLTKLNEIAGKHGIGRLDIVENRYVGMKSRGCYETPGGSVMLRAHRALESICLDRELAHLKDEIMPRYAKLVYNGYWWSPERLAIQTLIDQTQKNVTGEVRLDLYKGNITVTGRKSEAHSLFSEEIATFEDDQGAYDQKDAEGFIKLNALRLRIQAGKNS
jgi:argininosuccinate synthase